MSRVAEALTMMMAAAMKTAKMGCDGR